MNRNLADIVIDTNILLDAQNPKKNCFEAAVFILRSVLNSKTRVCVDEKFDMRPDRNTSMIGWGYLRKLHHGSYAYNFISTMLQNERFLHLPKYPDQRTKRIIIQCVRNTRDRVFVGVACSSCEGVLISHDFRDFSRSKRVYLRRVLQVHIHCSNELCERLFAKCGVCSR